MVIFAMIEKYLIKGNMEKQIKNFLKNSESSKYEEKSTIRKTS